MTSASIPAPGDSPDGISSRSDGLCATDEAVRRFTEAVARLTNDPGPLIDWFTEMLDAIKPPPHPTTELTEDQVRYLIEAGAFTVSGKETPAVAGRGSLKLEITQSDFRDLQMTWSIGDLAGYLVREEHDLLTAVTQGRLYAIKVLGLPRFPIWQFDDKCPGKLIPGLQEIIRVVLPRWGWPSVDGFMTTPQSSLVAEGRKTPLAWLRDGGDVDAVTAIVKAWDPR